MIQQSFSGPSVVIVGGGFAGASLAIHLLDGATAPFRLTIIEQRAALGRGLAYSTTDPVHLVNGPASIFSLYEDDPSHFTRWTVARAGETGWAPPTADPGEGFAPRSVYGAYVQTELARAVDAARGRVAFRHLRADALDVRIGGAGAEVVTSAGAVTADVVVLATGVFPLAGAAALAEHSALVRDPWDAAGLDRLVGGRGTILLIGASLSMVDAVASLEARGYRGRYLAVSRRGHLIEARRTPEPVRDFLAEGPLPRSARALLARVIRERRAILAAGGDWQALPPAIRPHLAALWAGASDVERRRFARHLRALWDVTLHRAAPDSFAALNAARSGGRFRALAGRIGRVKAERNAVAVEIRWRGTELTDRPVFDGVIDCRGHQEHDWRRIDAPLVRNLLASGAVRPHATGFGIDATGDGRVIGADGAARPELRALGHPLRGVAWESSSIPEQREQATALGARLLGELFAVAARSAV